MNLMSKVFMTVEVRVPIVDFTDQLLWLICSLLNFSLWQVIIQLGWSPVINWNPTTSIGDHPTAIACSKQPAGLSSWISPNVLDVQQVNFETANEDNRSPKLTVKYLDTFAETNTAKAFAKCIFNNEELEIRSLKIHKRWQYPGVFIKLHTEQLPRKQSFRMPGDV